MNNVIEYKKLKEAIAILGLPEEATLDQIKDNYRTLSLQYHPDCCKENDTKKCEEMFKKINNAQRLVMAYCAQYTFSFREKDTEKHSLEKAIQDHKKRFYEGWI